MSTQAWAMASACASARTVVSPTGLSCFFSGWTRAGFCAPSSSQLCLPDAAHTKCVEPRVPADHRNVQRKGLRRNHPVERVAVFAGKAGCTQRILGIDGEQRIAILMQRFQNPEFQGRRLRQFSNANFGRNLPHRYNGDKQYIFRSL